MNRKDKAVEKNGFSLIELIISIGILTVGLLSLAGTIGISIVNSDRPRQLTIAKYIAVATLETMVAARETGVLNFTELDYISAGNPRGFVQGIRPVRNAGCDRIFGTNDDGANTSCGGTETSDLIYTIGPNPVNGRFDGTNDERVNLTQLGYQREIEITNLDFRNGVVTSKRVQIHVYLPSPVLGLTRRNNRSTFTMEVTFGSYNTAPTGGS
ncbi:MAG: prepilin-type N-terminal cleavage/methylation domain-containing protein [Blastocatellia bacterium]|nr:prepilin-type N-terminal cleavage/methylation domain-containing protein [Blastocatellia bacterium]